ncbi:MAG: ArsR/SmtB family transcription factor [Eubacteriales bacterium]
MKNLKFIKEPGYTYDLFFIFTLYFNKEYCLTNFINYNKSSEDTDYFNKLFSNFQPISDELLPFFYLKDDKKSFMTQFYYEPYKEEFTTTYNLSSVQTLIADYDKVVSNLIKFYFLNVTEQTLMECKNSVTAIGRLIRNSDYSSNIKSSLYSFFLEPIPFIQKLSYELTAKEFELSQQYEKQYKDTSELQRQIDIVQISEKFKQCKNQKCDLDYFDDIYISVCILSKNCIKLHYYDGKAVLLLGTDYDSCFDYIINQNHLPELDAFGNVISEKNRIEILNLILRKGEIIIKDIEQELGFTGTNAYYHLSLMIRVNMIKSRNQGRTVLYSINKQYFDAVCDMLGKYLKS